MLTLIGPGNSKGLQMLVASTKDPASEPMTPVLEMFCESAYLLFLTLSDEEIYNRQHPFTLAQFSTLSTFLNSYCFQLHLRMKQSIRPSLTDAALKLLGALYDRNDRRAWMADLPEKRGVAGFFAGMGFRGGKESETSPWVMPQMVGKDVLVNIKKGDATTSLILNVMPQTIPFRTRVDIFRDMVKSDKATVDDIGFSVRIRRKAVLEDGFTFLAKLSGAQFKQTFRIVFVNELGMDEPGIDQRGVFKEFIELLLKRAFSGELGLFKPTADNTIYPSSKSGIHENHLDLLHFTGRMLAKALYEGIVIDYPFALFFYSKLLSQYTCLDDLPSLDPELYKNLTFLKHYERDCADLGLTFTIDDDVFGKKVSQELKPGGRKIDVTNENRFQYIYLMADFVLNQQAKEQNRAFIRGFKSVISDTWLRIFSASELQKLMSGEGADFDPKELRTYTRYEGGFFDQHKTIRWLWQCVEEMSPKEKSAFLRFATSCSKPPVGGFQHLQPTFTIRAIADEGDHASNEPSPLQMIGTFVGLGKDSTRLPTAATCFNMLKLPVFKTKQALKEKLLYAINANAGFELA
ncbi:HECT-domain-containing protein [Gonapodya prolifera JEL478]|uniref:HECT-type E3 ubiquitin transferase n=1 Tax=Gonapodya prolifera (strain JEL478) TaxID=1344416 RepID=A0A139ASY0_GONPJ|nr:HECT-domain-containing protein [Gonapodya prolifera JEL478]|eukprot:KXS19663.1 HECT-domain-containing protein [Gonapodya prolifera JEL478]